MSESIIKTTSKKATAKKATTKRVAKKRVSKKDLFSLYIDNIKKARLASQELVAPYEKEEKSTLIINLIWEAIFDYFCRIDKEEISPSNLNTLAGVVQKLLATSKDIPSPQGNTCISPKSLAEIEDKLNLL